MENPARSPLGADFRALMAGFPTGVAVVTVLDTGAVPRGMTCSSVCSVTLSPPTLLVCLWSGSPTLAAILRQQHFSVNLLHEHAQQVAELFASGDPERFSRVHWSAGAGTGGPHLDEHAHATADCAVAHTRLVGDHVVIFGEVSRIVHRPANRPLLYGRRRYAAWPHSAVPEPATPGTQGVDATVIPVRLKAANLRWDGQMTGVPPR